MSDNTFQLELEGGLKGLTALMESVGDALTKIGVPLATVSKYEISVEEIVLNTLKHGKGDEMGASVYVCGSCDGKWAEVSIRDNANPFNPLKDAPQPEVSSALEDRDIGGLGVYLVQQMMDETHYRLEDNEWNNFTMRCRCDKGGKR